MSLSIYETVVQPILRRLSRSSNDSDNPRITPQPSNPNRVATSDQEQATLENVPNVSERETALRAADLVRLVGEPTLRTRNATTTTTAQIVPQDSLLTTRPEYDLINPHELTHSIQDTVSTAVTRAPSALADDDTSSNPSHRVPHSLRSHATSASSSVPSIQDVEIAQSEGISATGQPQREREDTRGADGTLPADDGMRMLRKRIFEIQNAEASQEDKSRRMHALMTEQYNSSQPSLQSPHLRSISPASLRSHERPATPRSITSLNLPNIAPSPSNSLSPTARAPLTFNVSAEDRKATRYTKNQIASAYPILDSRMTDEDGDLSEVDESRLPFGCAHYKRNIKLQCSACDRWYTCRFCHDEVEDHSLNRRETKNMLCMFCGYAQKASDVCAKCEERAAWYYCDVCKLWDDDPERSIYHCDDCGICRVGQGLGKDFFHCKTCCVCLSIRMANSHRCIERSTDCDCPICGEYMFTSPQTVVFMQCGHSIHHECYKEHMRSSYKCPICSRSVVNMEIQFDNLQRQIDLQPMPPQFKDTKAVVYCNDCSAKTTVKYHWLGTRCEICKSFNTAQIRILTGPNSEAAPLEALHAMEGLDLIRDETTTASRPPSRPPSRGRSTQLASHSRRPVTSASAVQGSHNPEQHLAARATRSASPGILGQTSQDASLGTSSIESTNLEDDEFEELNILGMHSPVDHDMSSSLHASSEDEDDEDEESSTDENDEDMIDDTGSEEGEGLDPMEIQGHW